MRVNEIWPFKSKVATYAYAEELVTFIKDQCQPWLNQTNNGKIHVFRGIHKSKAHGTSYVPGVPDNSHAFIKHIGTNRPARGSTDLRILYTKLLKSCGAVSTRENSVSVTSNISNASTFGTPYVFIPIGDFNFTWSTILSDWGAGTDIDGNSIRNELLSGSKDIIMRFKNSIQHDDNSLPEAINSRNEIAIHAKSGLYVKPHVYLNLPGVRS